MNAVSEALEEVLAEYVSARTKHAPMRGPHEGYGVLLEELDELWDEIKANGPTANLRSEARQVAAMAVAFMVEVAPWPEVSVS